MHSFSILTLLVGLIYLLVAFIMKKRPPGQINRVYGYRTPRSMKNQENWDEGNRYSTKLLFRFGYSMLLLSVLGQIIPENESLGFIAGMTCILGSAFCLIYFTERHLKKMFEK
ncbi:MAG: SdpI family protein [Bacteroidetes bacterium]|nr:MAG: SdpI family protein [Bacteroidota bacterium]